MGHSNSMNTDNFDKQATKHLSFYEGFLSYSKYLAVGVIAILVLMAIFLL
ncbi:MAG: aa3-type cytochrome c oxidase subunit IV [Alphaproteobacteria bacterium]|nr:aa3-type cytochrome c oxidase subunit IV [Alphaproteobacteria bacterium]